MRLFISLLVLTCGGNASVSLFDWWVDRNDGFSTHLRYMQKWFWFLVLAQISCVLDSILFDNDETRVNVWHWSFFFTRYHS
mmetsp:Transcript_13533/g.27669  ORF Transcript_13533/g.27669 Transcript_13533/m.27669 type:complete len:81 (+) Transcript_13533:234-476(+)